VQNVHDQITFFIKSFFFTFIGAMLSPPWGQIALGVMLGVLLLVSRVPSVALSLIGSKLSLPAKGLVAVSLPRGMAAGVLAMVPWQSGMAGTESLSVVVFASVFTTILIFAIGFPLMKRKLVASDPSALAPIQTHPHRPRTPPLATKPYR
jgi:cell volume regulation protein A